MNTLQTNANRHTDVGPSLVESRGTPTSTSAGLRRDEDGGPTGRGTSVHHSTALRAGGLLFTLLTLLTLLLLAPRVQADPPVMSGLTIWLDATDLNGDGNLANNPAAGTAVSQWDNKASGYSTLDASQGAAGYQPKMFRDATTGNDVVRFNGSHLLFNDATINTLMSTTNTMFAVARANLGLKQASVEARGRQSPI